MNRIDSIDTVVFHDGSRFEAPPDVDAYRDALHGALPDERGAVDQYLKLIVELDKQLHALSTATGLTGVPRALRSAATLLRHSRTTLGDTFDRLQLSPRARQLLGRNAGSVGLPPSQTPLVLHAAVAMGGMRGRWYPAGGSAVIADRLAEVVTAHGGEFLLGHEVTRIEVGGGAVTGVEVRAPDGATRHLGAEVVVSNADIKRTFLDLLAPDVVPESLRRQVRGYRMSLPFGVVYTVLDRDLAAEGVAVNNVRVIGDDAETALGAAAAGRFAARPIVGLASSTLKDPGNPRSGRPGQTNVELLAMAPPHPQAWGLTAGSERGEAYQAAKRAFRDQLMAAADRAVPGPQLVRHLRRGRHPVDVLALPGDHRWDRLRHRDDRRPDREQPAGAQDPDPRPVPGRGQHPRRARDRRRDDRRRPDRHRGARITRRGRRAAITGAA